jgi:uncharacterized spore protein YtfJ
MRVLLMGVGTVGQAIARLAAAHPWCEAMVLADYDLARAEALQARLGDPERFAVEHIDASDGEAVAALARRHRSDLDRIHWGMVEMEPGVHQPTWRPRPRIRLDWSHQTDTEVRAMNVDEMLQGARDTMSVSRVYGEPIERNGVMLIPAADIKGGGGGGSDTEHNGGGGFGVSARPVGTWIIRGDQVTWEPAIDINRIALRGMVVAIVFLFVVRSLVKSFTRRR